MKKGIEEEIIKHTKKQIDKPLFIVSDRFAKPAISLYLIKLDIHEIIDCISRAEQFLNKDSFMVSALWKNAIVAYGKIFTKSGDGYSSLETNCISKDHTQLHKILIQLRNSFIAHRGNNDIENCLLVAYEKRENGKVHFEYTFPAAFQIGHIINEVEEVKKLLLQLDKVVDEKLNKKIQKIDAILWKELKAIGIDTDTLHKD